MDLNFANQTIAMHRLGEAVAPDQLLLAGALAKDLGAIVQALALGASPDAKTHQANALTLACYFATGQEGAAHAPAISECLRTLVQAGARLDEPQGMIHTPAPLVIALALDGRLDLCEILLDGGAEVDATYSHSRRGGADACVRSNCPAALRMLIARGLDFERADLHGVNAVRLAAAIGRLECFQILVDAGADLFADGPLSRPPIHAALESEQPWIRDYATALMDRRELNRLGPRRRTGTSAPRRV